MKVVVAPDSFKGTFTAQQAAMAMAEGIAQARHGTDIALKPMADGGEGSLDVVLSGTAAQRVSMATVDSYGREITAEYGWDNGTAWIELAQASGLHFLPEFLHHPEQRNQWAMRASTWGTGQQWRHALARGAHTIFFMIGGSGTTDGGFGLLSALGALYRFQKEVVPGTDARQLALPVQIEEVETVRQLLAPIKIVVATDVTNPLWGPRGAAAVYGPQKGLSPAGVRQRDEELRRFGEALVRAAKTADASVMEEEGMGAAGGAAFPLRVLGREVRLARGADLMVTATGLAEEIAQADIVFTGEGATDAQTLSGKVPMAVLNLCRQYQKPCIVVSGHLGEGAEQLKTLGNVWLEQATPRGATAQDIQQHGYQWIAEAAARALLLATSGA
ncbi:MAG: glycerate kinase [Sulfobacillus thermotolerans]|uniref:Glycerate kinase n=1 Tax=Sulfobacillus thermotolerans TaxID=338644 RepID=A0ABM6RPS8_9FIRM|nr:hypothetical protein BXT84_05215 [Sulfobacillus thermotolerans]MCY0906932.1 glycerate kinase [Sulfobacillus thermotolerans]